jgi:hypothetical protein
MVLSSQGICCGKLRRNLLVAKVSFPWAELGEYNRGIILNVSKADSPCRRSPI